MKLGKRDRKFYTHILAPELGGSAGADESSVSVCGGSQQLAVVSNHSGLCDGDERENQHVLRNRTEVVDKLRNTCES